MSHLSADKASHVCADVSHVSADVSHLSANNVLYDVHNDKVQFVHCETSIHLYTASHLCILTRRRM